MANYEVLVVDDDLETAVAFSDYISKAGSVLSLACSKPSEALDAVRKHPIKVAVLDQKMPGLTGTELYAEILKIRPEVRAIMLSGEAERGDVSHALSLKYVADIEKGNPADLIKQVHKALVQARAEKLVTIDPPALLGEKTFLGLIVHARYYLVSIESISEPYVPDNLWRLDGQISAGETRIIKYTRSVENKLIFDQSFLAKQSMSLGFSSAEILRIQGKLEGELERRSTVRIETSMSESSTMEITLTLPPEPSDPLENVVKSRGFYSGPEYIDLMLGIDVDHLRIGEKINYKVLVSVHTGYFIGRQLDTLTDGTKMERDTNRWT